MRLLLVVLVTLLSLTSAYAEVIGDWQVHTKDLYAATSNDSDQVFGQFCYVEDSSCLWLVGITVACDEGQKYPVLANSDAAAVHLEMLCLDGKPIEGGRYRYAFTDFDRVDRLVRESQRVGFAMPMQEDSFRVIRFNLRGSDKALSKLDDAINKLLKSAPHNTYPPLHRGTSVGSLQFAL
jgi:hypothetical protein